ncbi:MAG: hypothetical protein PHS74_12415 [Lachnospiraceae bacterium]|nr:hypothetical protein [Lachnospiraceae bacterium]
MKCIRASFEVEVEKYEVGKNMEDGFELWTDVVTKGWIVTDFLVKITRPDGTIWCPYVKSRRGCTFIGEGDYIITEEDNSKHVCGADKVFQRFHKINEEIEG